MNDQNSTRSAAAQIPLTPGQVRLLRETFERIEAQGGVASLVFYQHLFALEPKLRGLFHTSIELQGRKLMDSLRFTVDGLEKPGTLLPALEAMGRRHVSYGTRNEHYALVVKAMLQMMQETLGTAFTPEVRAAWTTALTFVSEEMQRGARAVLELKTDRG